MAVSKDFDFSKIGLNKIQERIQLGKKNKKEKGFMWEKYIFLKVKTLLKVYCGQCKLHLI